jgi:hypothetical protein
MATIIIPDSTYQRLKEVSSAMRLPLEKFLDRIASGAQMSPVESSIVAKPGTPEWIEEFDAWVSSHATQPNVADDSRDVVYGDEHQ